MMEQQNIFRVATPDHYTREDCDDPRLVFDLQELVDSIPEGSTVVIDTETTGLWPHRGHRLFQIQFYVEGWERERVLDMRFVDRDRGLEAVQVIIDKTAGAIFHNAKFDLKMMLVEGLTIPAEWCIDDTKLLAFCVNENRLNPAGNLPKLVGSTTGLDFLTQYYDAPLEFQKRSDIIKNWLDARGLGRGDMIKVPPSLMVQYAGQDVIATHWLWDKLFAEVQIRGGWGAYEIERKLPLVLARMELRGQPVDVGFLADAEQELGAQVDAAAVEFAGLVGEVIDLGKDDAVRVKLQSIGCKWPSWATTEKGNPRTDRLVLEALKHPAADALLEWREASKMLGTYVTPWLHKHQVDGFIHGNFNQAGSRPGRFTADDPNLQNVPTRTEAGQYIRQAFVCREGFELYYFDYSQIEYRFFAHYSGDKQLIDGYNDSPDFDIHQQVADVLGVSRTVGKTINFGTLFGMGVKKLALSLGIPQAEAQKFLDDYMRKFKVGKLKGQIERRLKTRGYVEDLFGGRQRYIGRDEHKFINRLIQGTAARALKHRMPHVDELVRRGGGHLIGTIHDELIVELPADTNRDVINSISDTMEDFSAYDISVPIIVDVEHTTTTWADKKGYRA